MADMLQLIRVHQVDLVQVIQPQCLSGEVIITLLLAVMLQAFPVIQLRLAQLRLMLVIQTVQQCTLNLVQTEEPLGVQILEVAHRLEPLVALHQAHHI
jgi:hypothetical protein